MCGGVCSSSSLMKRSFVSLTLSLSIAKLSPSRPGDLLSDEFSTLSAYLCVICIMLLRLCVNHVRPIIHKSKLSQLLTFSCYLRNPGLCTIVLISEIAYMAFYSYLMASSPLNYIFFAIFALITLI